MDDREEQDDWEYPAVEEGEYATEAKNYSTVASEHSTATATAKPNHSPQQLNQLLDKTISSPE